VQEDLGYPKDAVLVIVHVDDLGMHRDETDASLETMRYGLARTGSVMVPAPDFRRFTELWKADPTLDVGIHITLNSEWKRFRWPAVLSPAEVPSLLDPDGFLWRNQDLFMEYADPAEAVKEMEAQVMTVLAHGLSPTHIDPHMGTVFYREELFQAMVRLAGEYNLVIPYAPPEKLQLLRRQGFVVADSFNGFYEIAGEESDPGVRRRTYYNWLRGLGPGVHFLYIHPARVTDELAGIIETPYVRSGDFDIWTGSETAALADELGIHFIGIRELQKVQEKRMAAPSGGT